MMIYSVEKRLHEEHLLAFRGKISFWLWLCVKSLIIRTEILQTVQYRSLSFDRLSINLWLRILAGCSRAIRSGVFDLAHKAEVNSIQNKHTHRICFVTKQKRKVSTRCLNIFLFENSNEVELPDKRGGEANSGGC